MGTAAKHTLNVASGPTMSLSSSSDLPFTGTAIQNRCGHEHYGTVHEFQPVAVGIVHRPYEEEA